MARQPGLPPSLTNAHVLLLENEPILLLTFEEELRALGCSVTCVRTVASALAALDRQLVDLAVLDIHLSSTETCFDVASELLKRGIPFVFASGSRGEEVPAGFRGFEFVTKPFAIGALEEALLRARGQVDLTVEMSQVSRQPSKRA